MKTLQYSYSRFKQCESEETEHLNISVRVRDMQKKMLYAEQSCKVERGKYVGKNKFLVWRHLLRHLKGIDVILNVTIYFLLRNIVARVKTNSITQILIT